MRTNLASRNLRIYRFSINRCRTVLMKFLNLQYFYQINMKIFLKMYTKRLLIFTCWVASLYNILFFQCCRNFIMATGMLTFLVVTLLAAVTLSTSTWRWHWQRPDLGPVSNTRAQGSVVVLGMINSGWHQRIWWQADCRVKAIKKMDEMRQVAEMRYNIFIFARLLICNGNRTEWSPIPSVIIRVITTSDDSVANYQLILKATISEKRRIAKLWKKGKICVKRLTKESRLWLVDLNYNFECDWLI